MSNQLDFAYNPASGWCRSAAPREIVEELSGEAFPTSNELVWMLPANQIANDLKPAVQGFIDQIGEKLKEATGEEITFSPYVYLSMQTRDKETNELIDNPSIFLKKDDRVRIRVDATGILTAFGQRLAQANVA